MVKRTDRNDDSSRAPTSGGGSLRGRSFRRGDLPLKLARHQRLDLAEIRFVIHVILRPGAERLANAGNRKTPQSPAVAGAFCLMLSIIQTARGCVATVSPPKLAKCSGV